MLSTPKFTRTRLIEDLVLPISSALPGTMAVLRAELCGRGKQYGRLAGSDEHSPGFAVPGSQSGHALQVCERAKDSCVQTGQPLALQEIEAGSVDGRKVH